MNLHANAALSLKGRREPAPVVVLGVSANQVGAGCGELELSFEEDEAIQVAPGRGAGQRSMGLSPQRRLLKLGEAGCCFGRRGPWQRG